MLIAAILNLGIGIYTIYLVAKGFFNEQKKLDWAKGWKSLRYFTTLSNVFSAILCLVAGIIEIAGGYPGDGLMLVKYMSAVSVMVTFTTVMVFLGPIYGYKSQLSGAGMWVHLFGPLLAMAVFCFLEKTPELGWGQALLGLIPTIVYGSFYLYMVIIRTEKNGGWEDFYAFNRGGKWPISFGAMVVGTGVLCVLVTVLHNL
ncbi:MAG: hypothetical protein J5589_02045 [Firmicutes bacterium]|nr:hypothetical protein [Bacillota bacterium]